MNAWFEKLERLFGGWIDTMDATLEQPVSRVLTGEIFKDDITQRANGAKESSSQPAGAQIEQKRVTPDCEDSPVPRLIRQPDGC